MTKHKTVAWLWGIASLLAFAAVLRNIFAPGFLSISPHPVDKISTALGILAGVIFGFSCSSARGERAHHGITMACSGLA